MFLIIWYHIFIFVFAEDNPDVILYKAIQMPMHIGVPLFVMTSGYFGIRFSFKSLLGGVISKLYVLAVPIAIYISIKSNSGLHGIINSFMVLGQHNFWFINTYLCLYLVAPAITTWFDTATARQRWVLIAGLTFFSVYIGDIHFSDPALTDGKNLLNFIYLYLIGRLLHIYQGRLTSISNWCILFAYVSLIIISVILYVNIHDPYFRMRWWSVFYPYNSPFLIFESCLVFILFGRIKIQSNVINWFAGSVFAMYIVHGAAWGFIVRIVRYSNHIAGSAYIQILLSIVIVLIIMSTSILIDKAFNPVWRLSARQGARLDKWYKASGIS